MIHVYRIGRTRYARDLKGEGARLFGGRWNHKSIPCIYTSESRSLALLEYTVNINIDEIPRALSFTTFEMLSTDIQLIEEADLPGNWKQAPAPPETKDFGSRFFWYAEYPVLKIPSSIIPAEFNYIINPLHAGIKNVSIIDVSDFVYDIRIKTV